MGMARTLEIGAGSPKESAPNVLAELLALGRPLVMGILNVTPDSFSDGGRFSEPAKAVAHARDMAAQGADIIDIGAESTRPYGSPVPVSADDEKTRLATVLPAVVAIGVPVSIDTIKASIAAWALDEGAAIVNDVWGLQSHPDMAPPVGKRREPVVAKHKLEFAAPAIDIVAEVNASFSRPL